MCTYMSMKILAWNKICDNTDYDSPGSDDYVYCIYSNRNCTPNSSRPWVEATPEAQQKK